MSSIKFVLSVCDAARAEWPRVIRDVTVIAQDDKDAKDTYHQKCPRHEMEVLGINSVTLVAIDEIIFTGLDAAEYLISDAAEASLILQITNMSKGMHVVPRTSTIDLRQEVLTFAMANRDRPLIIATRNLLESQNICEILKQKQAGFSPVRFSFQEKTPDELKETLRLFERGQYNVLVGSYQVLSTGWFVNLPRAGICATSVLPDRPTMVQLAARVRYIPTPDVVHMLYCYGE